MEGTKSTAITNSTTRTENTGGKYRKHIKYTHK